MKLPASLNHLASVTFPQQRGYRMRAAIIVPLLLLFLSSAGMTLHQLVYAQDLPPLRYSSTSNILTIGRSYLPLLEGEGPFVTDPSNPAAPKLSITLPELRTWVESIDEPDLIREVSAGIWEIAVEIEIEDNAQLALTRSSGLQEVRLISRPDASYNLISVGGTLTIDGIKLYSWDNSSGVDSYDSTFLTKDGVMQSRSFLAALYGGRMDIIDAEVMYLGYEELNERVGYGKGEPSGLAWRLRPAGTEDPAHGPKGSIIHSKVHHNYFGMYSYEATNLEIRDSEFYDHYFYGLDPHDYSHGFVVANNRIHDNGYTGLIFSRYCTDNTIYGNEIYHNGSHGFMLDRGSDRNLVYQNTIYENKNDGIAVYQSSNNEIYENTIYGHERYGIRLSAEFDEADLYDGLAIDNLIRNNQISRSGRDGIYVTDRADRNRILENTITDNARVGLLLNSGQSTVQGNLIAHNGREGLLIDDEAYTSGTNKGGVALAPIATPGGANQILANEISGNGDAGIIVDRGSANQIGSLGAGNLISGNLSSGLLLNFTAATVVSNNEILHNRAGNGAGILAKCDAATPITHQIIDNVITANFATDNKGRGAGIFLMAGCLAQVHGNRLYANENSSYTANLQNGNPADSLPIDASNNLWNLSESSAIENTIWHGNDDPTLGMVTFLPLGDGPLSRPPTPVPTATALETATPTVTPAPTVTPDVKGSEDGAIYLPYVQR